MAGADGVGYIPSFSSYQPYQYQKKKQHGQDDMEAAAVSTNVQPGGQPNGVQTPQHGQGVKPEGVQAPQPNQGVKPYGPQTADAKAIGANSTEGLSTEAAGALIRQKQQEQAAATNAPNPTAGLEQAGINNMAMIEIQKRKQQEVQTV